MCVMTASGAKDGLGGQQKLYWRSEDDALARPYGAQATWKLKVMLLPAVRTGLQI